MCVLGVTGNDYVWKVSTMAILKTHILGKFLHDLRSDYIILHFVALHCEVKS